MEKNSKDATNRIRATRVKNILFIFKDDTRAIIKMNDSNESILSKHLQSEIKGLRIFTDIRIYFIKKSLG